MPFRPSKAAPPRRRSSKASSGHSAFALRGGIALGGLSFGYEPLEQRTMLSFGNVVAVPVAPVEGQPILEQPVADIIVAAGSGYAPADFTASINWGDGTTNTADIASTSSNTTFAVLGTHTYSEEGPASIQITVKHGTDTPVTITQNVAVSDPAVDVQGGATFTATAGATPSAQIVATFTDPGGNEGATTDYSASIYWGDGTITAGTIAYNSFANDFSVTGGGNHVYANNGLFTLTVTVSHDSAPKATATTAANVAEPSVNGTGGYTYTGIEGGVAFNEKVATFTDPAGAQAAANYSATVVWGNDPITNQPITSTGTVSLGKDGTFTVMASHVFSEETPTTTLAGGATTNLAPISVVLGHGPAMPDTVVSYASVSDAPLQMSGAPTISAAEGVGLTNVPLATFVDTGGAEQLEDYAAAIDWADNATTPGVADTVTPGTVTFNNGTFTVSGTHTYHTGGLHPVTISVNHDTAPVTAVLTPITVSDPAVVGTGGYTFTATEALPSANETVATFTDPGGAAPIGQYSASINWGDSVVSPGTITYNTVSQVFTVSGQHTYEQAGSLPISVTITHQVAPATTVTSNATIAYQPIQATGGITATAVEYTSFGPQTLATFTDLVPSDSPSNFSASINWGDGSASAGTITPSAVAGNYTVAGSHTFTQTGSFKVAVTVHHTGASDVTVQDVVNVSRPGLSLTTQPLTWKEWTPLEAPDNALATLPFVDSTMQATVNWGDGSTGPGTVMQYVNGGAGAVLGAHTWTEAGTYTVTVTVTDGASHATQSFPVTVLAPVLPLPNATSGTPTNYYVSEIYEDVLRRLPDSQGLQYWSALLDQGVPRSSIATALAVSNEYLTNFVINPAYEKYLGRPADSSGISYWLVQMHAGLTDEGLAASLASSTEFYIKAGNSDIGFVDALYRLVLNRTPDPAGQTFWVGQLARGESRYNVSLGFTTSAEDRTAQVTNTYQALLGRNPSVSELEGWLSEFALGQTTNEAFIASLTASDEYYARAVNEEFV